MHLSTDFGAASDQRQDEMLDGELGIVGMAGVTGGRDEGCTEHLFIPVYTLYGFE